MKPVTIEVDPYTASLILWVRFYERSAGAADVKLNEVEHLMLADGRTRDGRLYKARKKEWERQINELGKWKIKLASRISSMAISDDTLFELEDLAENPVAVTR